MDGEHSATFDPLNNTLAAISTRLTDFRPQRYDRILLSHALQVNLEGLDRFGIKPVNGRFASDHYGLSASLRYQDLSAAVAASETPFEKTQDVEITTIYDGTDLDQFLVSYLPSEENTTQRVEAINILHHILKSDPRLSNLLLVPLGSHAMGTYFVDSDIDTLAIGSLSSKAFFETAINRLKLISAPNFGDSHYGLRAVHIVNSLVPIIEASVNGIKFDIQYCQAPELLQRYNISSTEQPQIEHLVFDSTIISKLSPTSLRPLNTYRDTLSILRSIPDLQSYRTAHRFLALSLKSRGLYSAKFGYLGGIHLSLMLHHLLKSLPSEQKDTVSSPASLVRTFFAYYAAFDWAAGIVADNSIAWHRTYRRSPREPVVILALHSPTARSNVAGSCTRLSAMTIGEEFKAAANKLEPGEEGWQWCLRPYEEVADEFLRSWGAFVRVKVDVWDITKEGREKARKIVGGIESKMTLLMVYLGKIAGYGLRARVWPGRFKVVYDEADENVLSGYYLVGISAREEGVSAEQKKVLQGKILIAARNFESELRASAVLNDVSNVWVEVEVVPRKKVREMRAVPD